MGMAEAMLPGFGMGGLLTVLVPPLPPGPPPPGAPPPGAGLGRMLRYPWRWLWATVITHLCTNTFHMVRVRAATRAGLGRDRGRIGAGRLCWLPVG